MKISVVMATYNGALHIREQLDSIERQTLTPDEVLIGDDGSSDATLAIVRDFAARTSIPVTVAEKSERLGFADNFLWTAEQSRHDLIALCDQDDRWLPDKLERARDRIKRDGSLLAMHTLTVADAALAPTGEVWRQGIEGDDVIEPLQLDPYVTGWGNSMMFRRELLNLFPRKSRPRQPEATHRPLSHDTWVYVLAAALGRVSHIAAPLLLYRQHGTNAAGLTLSRFWRLRRAAEMAVVPLERLRGQAAFHHDMARLFAQLAAQGGAFAVPARNAANVFGERFALSSARVLTFDASTAAERLQAYQTVRHLRHPARDTALSRFKALTMGVGGLSRALPFLVRKPHGGQGLAIS